MPGVIGSGGPGAVFLTLAERPGLMLDDSAGPGLPLAESPSLGLGAVVVLMRGLTLAERPALMLGGIAATNQGLTLAESPGLGFGPMVRVGVGLALAESPGLELNNSPFSPGFAPAERPGLGLGAIVEVNVGLVLAESPGLGLGASTTSVAFSLPERPGLGLGAIARVNVGLVLAEHPALELGGGVAGTTYVIYANTGLGDPVDYLHPIGSTAALSFPTAPLPTSSDWTFSVRARDNLSGQEEQGVQASVRVVIDSAGVDVTARATLAAPTGLRADPTAGGGLRAAWGYPGSTGSPTGFHVYVTAGSVVDWTAPPAATVPFAAGNRAAGINPFRSFSASLAGLADGIGYAIGVRAYVASGEAFATATTTATADATPPADVLNLDATAVAYQER